jgi:hypothetical protein
MKIFSKNKIILRSALLRSITACMYSPSLKDLKLKSQSALAENKRMVLTIYIQK